MDAYFDLSWNIASRSLSLSLLRIVSISIERSTMTRRSWKIRLLFNRVQKLTIAFDASSGLWTNDLHILEGGVTGAVIQR